MVSRGSLKKLDLNDDLPDLNWNKRLLDSKFGTIFQTIEYGKYEELIEKYQPKYLKFRNENNIVVGQILLFRLFRGKGKLAKLIPRTSVGEKYTTKWTWTHGPVVFDDSYYDAISEELFDFLSSKKFEGSSHPQDKKLSFRDKYNFGEQKAATFIIDLNQELDDIIKNTDKKSVQKNIERARERGVTVSEFSMKDLQDLKNYSDLLNKYRELNGFSPYSDSQVKAVVQLATSTGEGAGFLAWYDKMPIGGIFISAFNGYINEWGIARSKDDTEKKLYSQDLLRWTIIEWGKKKGCRFYDLSGVKYPEEHQSPKEKGIFKNKEKWGGKLTPYPTIFNK